MEYSYVVGNIDKGLVKRSQDKLTAMFLDLALTPTNTIAGTRMGGDPFIYSLMFPVKHICTENIPTAATNGKVFYWNPKFVLKNSAIGLRIIAAHEAWHAIYMHPSRLNGRDPRLWNICVDYIVNWNCIDGINSRKLNGSSYFKDYLGDYKTVEEFAEMIKDPFNAMNSLKEAGFLVKNSNNGIKLPDPMSETPLTNEQKKSIEDSLVGKRFYYADPDLEESMRKPEILYDYFLKLLPKCPECDKLGMYKIPDDSKSEGDDSKSEGDDDKSEGDDDKSEGDDDKSGGEDEGDSKESDGNGECNHGGCGTCGQNNGSGDGDKYIDVFGLGGTVDDHMSTDPDEKELSQRIADAMETASRLAGTVPASIEEELGRLTKPKMSWKDVIRGRQRKSKAGNTKNNWTSFKTRPMFAGIFSPKKISFASTWGCLVDTSGSMSDEDIAFGISQLQSLDREDEGTLVAADAKIYWDQATKVTKTDANDLSKFKVIGRGGTVFGDFFSDYKEKIGKCDFLVVITDGFLFDCENMRNPGIDVVWIITSHTTFKPPFGKSYHLRDDF